MKKAHTELKIQTHKDTYMNIHIKTHKTYKHT